MKLRKPMTEPEKELFKETVIKDYRLKYKGEGEKLFTKALLEKLKSLMPLEIIVGS